MAPKRMTANPIAPLRYRSGKPLPADDSPSSSEESDSDSDGSEIRRRPPAPPRAPPGATIIRPQISSDISARDAAAAAARKERETRARRGTDEDGFVTASDSSADDDVAFREASSADSDSEADYDSSSSSTASGHGTRFTAPVFLSKSARSKVQPGGTSEAQARREAREREEEDERETERLAKADAMLQVQIERAARERAEAARDWDDEAEVAREEDVDDTDGLDVAAEHAAWRLRELRRVKRERDVVEAAEAERAEVERRRGLTAEERRAEDETHIAKQKEEKDGRGKAAFMQQYFHRGAFFQGDGEADEAVREAMTRDIMSRQFEGHGDRELLPEYMQIRDMTKLGRKSRTRYKDLKSEDTGRFGGDVYDKGRGRGDAGRRYGDGPSGANDTAVGERRRREGESDGGDEKRTRFDGR